MKWIDVYFGVRKGWAREMNIFMEKENLESDSNTQEMGSGGDSPAILPLYRSAKVIAMKVENQNKENK